MELYKNNKQVFNPDQPISFECTIGELVYMLAGVGETSYKTKDNFVQNLYHQNMNFFIGKTGANNGIYDELKYLVNEYLRKEGIEVYDDD